ncbi:exodeoxyribonuclease VII small subunit [Acholeplasma oculi]|uniref:Exodeoxyribonuclease VII small subunit n=1 Tax=Acholeplasma oculi TaxID=35623 RepID=A0A061ABD5_9MOLU|nr:exodeoxyribonuclease VII small subunit [Acholeplasma oculi]CDR30694.1 Exodeoxyribonuclease VII, small subunit [Acholeplasma oculi]SKC34671.1 Exodeoxyribonuclease VII small subunit [Acholeplasma oculi]SUT89508.1 exodeoxyribonuclease VII small subunit [Acholeplasma oculi]
MSEKLSFEETIKRLENLVKELESKDISLELSIKKYKEGIDLSKQLYDMIKEAEALIVDIKE